jgi:ABC-type anion transport system duplicated permease subunit
MVSFPSNLTPQDLTVIGILILVPLLMAFGIYAIRREVRNAARIEARRVKLKTSKEQRQRWRQETTSRDQLNLLDDVETLLRLTNADEVALRQEHKEAVQLSWMSHHIPIRAALLGSLLLAGALSAILMVIALGPHNSIP